MVAQVRLKMMTCFFQAIWGPLLCYFTACWRTTNSWEALEKYPSPVPSSFTFDGFLNEHGVSLQRAYVCGLGSSSSVYLLMLIATMTGCHPDFRTSAREGLCLAIATQRGIMTMKTAQIRGERYFTSGEAKKSWIKCPWLHRFPKWYCTKSGRKAAGLSLRLSYVSRKPRYSPHNHLTLPQKSIINPWNSLLEDVIWKSAGFKASYIWRWASLQFHLQLSKTKSYKISGFRV